ncbi:hypothetical protein HPP92_007528 [Vanilla planifolia]|uniref:Uncharacterized protein n=1 Tax=Vanilla planifolia TaxID=51239 RepID=A0A835RH17_VANPL|nr:hypothetical protein HPP92_007752 [Vanilla planifolia]KAG0490665.1 hypothetical protein HPP92_007528 [Vanilla planifolia]
MEDGENPTAALVIAELAAEKPKRCHRVRPTKFARATGDGVDSTRRGKGVVSKLVAVGGAMVEAMAEPDREARRMRARERKAR